VLVPGIAAALCGVGVTAGFAVVALVLRHCGGRLADDTTVFAVRRP
jgi:hypothetical protein